MLWRERILDCALEIIDVDGLEALSTRRLAKELGVKSASLYNHFANKEAILRAVAEYAIRRTPLRDRNEGPRAMLLAGSKQLRDALLAHPSLVPVLVGQHRSGVGWDGIEGAAGRLLAAGIPPESILVLFESLERFIIGTAVREAANDTTPEISPDPLKFPNLYIAAQHRQSTSAAFDGTVLAIIDRFIGAEAP